MFRKCKFSGDFFGKVKIIIKITKNLNFHLSPTSTMAKFLTFAILIISIKFSSQSEDFEPVNKQFRYYNEALKNFSLNLFVELENFNALLNSYLGSNSKFSVYLNLIAKSTEDFKSINLPSFDEINSCTELKIWNGIFYVYNKFVFIAAQFKPKYYVFENTVKELKNDFFKNNLNETLGDFNEIFKVDKVRKNH